MKDRMNICVKCGISASGNNGFWFGDRGKCICDRCVAKIPSMVEYSKGMHVAKTLYWNLYGVIVDSDEAWILAAKKILDREYSDKELGSF